MDLRAMECDFSSTRRRPCANEGLLVGCRCPSRKSLENFGILPRIRCPTTVRACSDEVVLRPIATLPPGRPAPQSDMVRYHLTRAPGSLCGQTRRGAVVKIFLLGATGNSGRRILRLSLQRAHEVTAFVRDETKLLSLVDSLIPPNLHVSVGDVSKSADIARVMAGHDVAINAAGNVTEGSAFTQLVETVVASTIESLGEGGRLWLFGGAA